MLPDFHKGDKLMPLGVAYAYGLAARFEVYDKDIGKKDDFLGKCEVSGSKAMTGHGSLRRAS